MTAPEANRDQHGQPSGSLASGLGNLSAIVPLAATSTGSTPAVPVLRDSSRPTPDAGDTDEHTPQGGLTDGSAAAQPPPSTPLSATPPRIPDQGSDASGSPAPRLESGSDGGSRVDGSETEELGQSYDLDWQGVQAAAGHAAVTHATTTATTSDSGDAEHNAMRVASPGRKAPVPLAEDVRQSVNVMFVERSSDIAVRGGWSWDMDCSMNLDELPNEVLTQIFGYLEVCDLLATSRTNHHLRALSVQPILHTYRLHRARLSLGPLLTSPSRPTLRDLITRHIFLTNTTQISRRLARNLVAIRLSRRLPQRPTAEALVQRGVLPCECVEGYVAPGLVAKKRAVERERLKDGLRRWIDRVWSGEVRERAEGVRQWEENSGVGRVWKLRRFWERISRGEGEGVR